MMTTFEFDRTPLQWIGLACVVFSGFHPVGGPFCMVATQIVVPGDVAAQLVYPGPSVSQVVFPGSVAEEIGCEC